MTKRIDIGTQRPEPPTDLPAPAADLWRNIVDALPAGNFAAGDLPLLHAYCIATEQKAQADAVTARDGLVIDGKANPALKLSIQLAGALAALAGKLRLCPSSRTRPDAAGLKKALAAVRPWETGEPLRAVRK